MRPTCGRDAVEGNVKRTDVALPVKPVDYLVLLSLHGGERHGYGIVKDIERLTEGQVRLVPGNLYSVIARLVEQGLVGEVAPRSDDGRRRHYRLTAAGNRQLTAETRRLERMLARRETRRVLRGLRNA